MLDPDLRRAQNVAGGVERYAHAVDVDGLRPSPRLDRRVGAEPRAQHALRLRASRGTLPIPSARGRRGRA